MALSTFGETSNCWIIYIHTGDYKHEHTVAITVSFFEAAWISSHHTRNFLDFRTLLKLPVVEGVGIIIIIFTLK